jgi:hypothetical protein
MGTENDSALPDTSAGDENAFSMKMSLLKKNMILRNTWSVVDTQLLSTGVLQARETSNAVKHSKLGPFRRVLSVHSAFLKPRDENLDMEILTMNASKDEKTSTQKHTHTFRFISAHDRDEWVEKARKVMNSIKK